MDGKTELKDKNVEITDIAIRKGQNVLQFWTQVTKGK